MTQTKAYKTRQTMLDLIRTSKSGMTSKMITAATGLSARKFAYVLVTLRELGDIIQVDDTHFAMRKIASHRQPVRPVKTAPNTSNKIKIPRLPGTRTVHLCSNEPVPSCGLRKSTVARGYSPIMGD